MKVAICGSGPFGLEAALNFYEMDCSVYLISRGELGGNFNFLYKNFKHLPMANTWSEVTTEIGRKKINQTEKEIITVESYFDHYLCKLIALIKELDIFIIHGDILKVSKRFLNAKKTDCDENMFRLQDLFKITYQSMNDSKEVSKDREKGNIKYEYFDVVIDAMGVLHNPKKLDISGSFSIGEEELSKSFSNQIFYGLETIINPDLIKIRNDKKTTLVFVGSGLNQALCLMNLKAILLDHRHKINIKLITNESEPFLKLKKSTSNFKQFAYSETKKILDEFLAIEKELEKKYEKQLDDWMNLEDYEKVKIKRPSLDEHFFCLYQESVISGLDEFIDLDKRFITIEKINFSEDISQINLSTIQFDYLFINTGFEKKIDLFNGLMMDFESHMQSSKSEDGIHPEPGIYTYGPSDSDDRYLLSSKIHKIEVIKENLKKYFSRRVEA